jgi:hypothetical protein
MDGSVRLRGVTIRRAGATVRSERCDNGTERQGCRLLGLSGIVYVGAELDSTARTTVRRWGRWTTGKAGVCPGQVVSPALEPSRAVPSTLPPRRWGQRTVVMQRFLIGTFELKFDRLNMNSTVSNEKLFFDRLSKKSEFFLKKFKFRPTIL